MVSTLKCVQALRQCQRIKTNIYGKSIEVADVLSEEFLQRQNLENLYKSVLLSDVQYALDNKVELELWNNVFKEHIDNFRLKIKEKKMNNEKNDIQAKLSLFLDVSTGFYFQLLQEFCDTYDLDLPYHGKASQLGILSKSKKGDGTKPKINACLYVCQDCLVHLGDLARYRNDLQQAQTFYTLASKVLPGNGQPYNQLAILSSAKGNNLQAVFYYYKSISVPNPFPAASSNLQKTFCQMCAKQNYNIFTKSTGITVPEFVELFLNFSGCIYLMQDISKINALKDQLMQDFRDVLLELTQLQLVHMMSISIFNLQKCKHKNLESDSLTEEDSNIWHVSLLFCVQFMQVLLWYTTEMIHNQFQLPEMKCLPAIKLFNDWIVCSGSNMLAQEAFQENSKLYYDITVFANNLLTIQSKKEKSFLPLMEDWEMHGVNPFRKIHRRYDYRIQPVEVTVAQVWNIRVSRIFHFIDWLCLQEHMIQFLAKAEQNGKVEYICKQPSDLRSPGEYPRESETLTSSKQQVKRVLQKPKSATGKVTQGNSNDSIFPQKSRSLFRTESEEMHNLPVVKGPVQSYSLFDTIWNRQNTPPQESDTLSVGSPSVSLTSVGMFQESRPLHDPSSDIYGLGSKQEVARSLETPTFDITSQLTGLSKSAPVRKQSPEFRHAVNQMSERMQGFQINSQHPISQPGPMMASPTQAVPQPQSMRTGMWFKSQPSAPQMQGQVIDNMPQHRPPPPQQLQQQRGNFNGPIQQPYGSINMVIDPLHSTFVKTTTTLPSHTFISQPFPPQSSNFGAIGQNIRGATAQMGPVAPNPLIQSFGNSANLPIPQRSWAGPPPGIPDPMIESRSIWTSNFGIGQSEISPLEQLIKDQRRHQQPR